MHSKAKPPTKAERRRLTMIVELGCVACRMCGPNGHGVHAEIHHLLWAGVRRGHSATIGLCSWHHRGVPPADQKAAFFAETWGPSLALDARRFHSWFGSDDELLAYQNHLLTLSPEELGV